MHSLHARGFTLPPLMLRTERTRHADQERLGGSRQSPPCSSSHLVNALWCLLPAQARRATP